MEAKNKPIEINTIFFNNSLVNWSFIKLFFTNFLIDEICLKKFFESIIYKFLTYFLVKLEFISI